MNYDMVALGTLIRQAKTVRCGNNDYPILSMTMHNGLVFQEEKFKKIVASKDRSNYKVVYRNQLVVGFPIDEELDKLDELVNARFVELFESSKLSEETTLASITKQVKVGFVGTCEKYYTDESGVPMIRTGNITTQGINLNDLKYVTRDFVSFQDS